MTALLAIHLPASLPGFGHWLATHWPTARHGCRWEYGGRRFAAWRWQRICH
jgi:hypothetical protein